MDKNIFMFIYMENKISQNFLKIENKVKLEGWNQEAQHPMVTIQKRKMSKGILQEHFFGHAEKSYWAPSTINEKIPTKL